MKPLVSFRGARGVFAGLGAVSACAGALALAQEPPPTPPPALTGAPIPEVFDRITGLPLVPEFVADVDAAVVLGKALFWDMQAGSDGQACASCHFHAGADSRTKNQLSPGLLGGNGVFNFTRSGKKGANVDLTADDFPFKTGNDDVTSSQGVFGSSFEDIAVGLVGESVTVAGAGAGGDPIGFHVGGINVRRVEPRNTPTVINSVLFFRNFWDGRANNIFNGVNPFGRRDPNARILVKQTDGSVVPTAIELKNVSAASQADGPPGNNFEMSAEGRSFSKIGKKLLSLPPLALQNVDPGDSVLGSLVLDGDSNGVADAPGLQTTYADLIQAAFPSKYWDSDLLFDEGKNPIGSGAPSNTSEFTLMESNFSLFWGLAIHLYEAILISDDAPYDRFANGDVSALTSQQQAGLAVFLDKGRCINCHGTAMFSNASTLHIIGEEQEGGLIERMLMGQQELLYTVSGSVKIPGPSDGLRRVQFQGIETSGAVENGVSVPGPGVGKIRLQFGTTNCKYDLTSAQIGADGDPTTKDVLLTGVISSGDGICGTTVSVHVIDNPSPVKDVLTVVKDGVQVFQGVVSSGDASLAGPAMYDNGFYNIGVRR